MRFLYNLEVGVHSDWSIEIFSFRKSQSTNQNTYTTFAKVEYECIDREIQYTHILLFEAQYTIVDKQKLYEYILSGVGNSTFMLH